MSGLSDDYVDNDKRQTAINVTALILSLIYWWGFYPHTAAWSKSGFSFAELVCSGWLVLILIDMCQENIRQKWAAKAAAD